MARCRHIVVASSGKHWLAALRAGRGGRYIVEQNEATARRRMMAMKRRHKNWSVGMLVQCGVR